MDKAKAPTHVEICVHCKRICKTKPGLKLKAFKSIQNINININKNINLFHIRNFEGYRCSDNI